VQPPDGKEPDADTPPKKGATQRPEKTGAKKGATKDQKPWLRDPRGWFNKKVVAIKAITGEVNKAMKDCTPEQLVDLEPSLLLDASQSLEKKAAELVDYVEIPLEEAAAKLIGEGRVEITPAPNRATKQSQPEA
jgi:hypothetical protein